ncbi:hypothetical protein Tco_0394878 [Tanacetum coccineum]
MIRTSNIISSGDYHIGNGDGGKGGGGGGYKWYVCPTLLWISFQLLPRDCCDNGHMYSSQKAMALRFDKRLGGFPALHDDRAD